MDKSTPQVISGEDMEEAYEHFEGNFFEGSWMGNEALDAAMSEWAKSAFPGHHKDHPGKNAGILLETLIGDEEGRDALAGFVNSLSPALKKAALKGMVQDIKSMESEEAGDLIKRLDKVVKEIG